VDLIGHELGRYRLVELIGRGGMGAVYRAHDTVLHREVAVKVLTGDETDRRRERFRREARSVAGLSHPNILAIHDFGEHEGRAFAVTELLEGKDLAQRLGDGPLPVAEAVEVAVAAAEGLGEAHRQGLLHRDVKPHNIFITSEGEVKILDFGIARTTGRSGRGEPTESAELELTEDGAVVGTVAYMSPEQVRGEALDHRTDIFSLGTVLYEALTGSHPFRTASRAETLSAILRDDPPPPGSLRPGVPPALDEVVMRCLQKAPGRRFESATDLAFALRTGSQSADRARPVTGGVKTSNRLRARLALAAAAVALTAGGAVVGLRHLGRTELPEVQHIVVTRFQPVQESTELARLAAGMTEVVAHGLEVVDRSTEAVAWVRHQTPDQRPVPAALGEVSREYDPDIGIVGTLSRRGDRLRLQVGVIDPATGRALREISLEEGAGNPRSLQIEPVVRVAEMLGLALDQTTMSTLQAGSTTVTAALDDYLRGVGGLALASRDADVEAGIGALERSVAADPQFARPRLALAGACLERAKATGDPSWIERGLREAAAAARLPGAGGEAELVLGSLNELSGDLEAATAAYRRAVAAAPSDAEARVHLARALQRGGSFEEAERELQHAMFLRPGYWPDHHWAARLYLEQGRYDAAVNEFRRVVELAPQNVSGYTNLGTIYAYMDQPDRAREVFEQSLRVDPDHNDLALTNLGTLAFNEGRYADAAAMFERALAVDDSDYQVWGNLGHSYHYGSTPGKATEPLRHAIGLAESELRKRPDDPEVLVNLAGYHADLGERAAGLEALRAAAARDPDEPMVVAYIAEVFEDLGSRDEALRWVGRAFDLGVAPSYFGERPSLRDLIGDPRYRALVERTMAAPE